MSGFLGYYHHVIAYSWDKDDPDIEYFPTTFLYGVHFMEDFYYSNRLTGVYEW